MGSSEKESLENRINREIIVRREAQLEVYEAFRRYQEISEGLGFEFMRSLEPLYNPLSEILLHIRKFTKKRAAFCFANFLMRFSSLPKRLPSSLSPAFIKNVVKLIGCEEFNFKTEPSAAGSKKTN